MDERYKAYGNDDAWISFGNCHVAECETSDDAKRIVACLNACIGINPAAVPKLLAACKAMINERIVDEYASGLLNAAIDEAEGSA